MALKTDLRRKSSARGGVSLAALMIGAALLGASKGALASDSNVDVTQPASGSVTNQALLKKIDAMEQRIKSLEAQVKQKDAPLAAPNGSAESTSNVKPPSKANRTLFGPPPYRRARR